MLFGDDDQDWGGEVDIRRDGFVACDGPDMLTITKDIPVKLLPLPPAGCGVQPRGVDLPPLLFPVPAAPLR